MSLEPAIRCEDVWKNYRIYHQRSHSLKERILTRRNAYDEFWALQGVSFDVPVGGTVGIIGSNGSGKSTLLKVIARILTPNRGVVTSTGSMSSLLELGTGFHPELTGKENVFLAGSLLGLTKRDVEARFDAIVDFAGISEFMDLPVKNYSSGMYARLAFAVAISVDPEILLIDEVLSVGDEAFQMKCFERIAEFRSQGRTILLVSHSLDSVRSLCSDALWLDHGKVRAIGRAHDVVAEYLSEVHRTAEPVGTHSAERYGSFEAEIRDVELLNGEGQPDATFRTGEPLTFAVHYEAHRPIADAVCVIQIYTSDTLHHVFGQSTGDARFPLELQSEGTVMLRIPELPLLKGSFTVSVAIQDRAGKRIYDHHDRRYSFMVFENPALPFEAGSVHMNGEWSTSSSMAVQ